MLVLASQSPRRREILLNAGFEFSVRAANVPEHPLPGESPEDYVLRLAREKAAAAVQDPTEWVLAADTTVVVAGQILEKPADAADAVRMISLLSGRTHQVLTGVCLRHQGREWSAVESTLVHFLEMSPDEIRSYAQVDEPKDKAGAYAIQGLASKFIHRIEGCYFNVVGLPVSLVYRLLKDAGYSFNSG